MVCSEVEALAMGLCASYATFGEARGLLGVEDVPWSQARQVHVSRGTRSLIERALSSPGEGPRFLGARHGEDRNQRDQQIDRCGRARILSPVRLRLRKVAAHAGQSWLLGAEMLSS